MIRWNGPGETNPRARLTRRKVRRIRANPQGETLEQLAERYSVSVSHIYRIRYGLRWKRRATLDPEKVRQMKQMRDKGIALSAIAELYGVSRGHAWRVINGINWKEV